MKLSEKAVIRTVVLAVALCNQILTAFGKNPLPFAQEDLYEGLSAAAAVAATVWSWWKNNSFTKNAVAADAYLQELNANVQKSEE